MRKIDLIDSCSCVIVCLKGCIRSVFAFKMIRMINEGYSETLPCMRQIFLLYRSYFEMTRNHCWGIFHKSSLHMLWDLVFILVLKWSRWQASEARLYKFVGLANLQCAGDIADCCWRQCHQALITKYTSTVKDMVASVTISEDEDLMINTA